MLHIYILSLFIAGSCPNILKQN